MLSRPATLSTSAMFSSLTASSSPTSSPKAARSNASRCKSPGSVKKNLSFSFNAVTTNSTATAADYLSTSSCSAGISRCCSPDQSESLLLSSPLMVVMSPTHIRRNNHRGGGQPPALRLCYRHFATANTRRSPMEEQDDAETQQRHEQEQQQHRSEHVGEEYKHDDDDAPVRDLHELFPRVVEACRVMGLVAADHNNNNSIGASPANGTTSSSMASGEAVLVDWDAQTLKQKYHHLVRTHHPDIMGGDGALMEAINNANDLLEGITEGERVQFKQWMVAGGGDALMSGVCGKGSSPYSSSKGNGVKDQVQLVGAGLFVTLAWGVMWGTYAAYIAPAAATATANTNGNNNNNNINNNKSSKGGKAPRGSHGTAHGVSFSVKGGNNTKGFVFSTRIAAIAYTLFTRYARSFAVAMAACAQAVVLRSVVLPLLCAFFAP